MSATPDNTTGQPSGSSLWTPKRIGAIVLAAVALIFVFSNTAQVTLKWLGLSISAPAWLMLLVLLLLGVAIGFLFGRKRYRN